MKFLISSLKIISISVFFIYGCIINTDAQTQINIDSLLKTVNKEPILYKKTNLYYSIGDAYKFKDSDSAIYFNTTGLKYALLSKIDTLISIGYYKIAATNAAHNHYEEALRNCDSAFKFFKLNGNRHALAMVRNVQGGVYMVSGNNDLAFKMYHDAIGYTEDDTASNRILFTYGNLTILLNNMKKHSLALEYGIKQYKWAKRLNIKDEIAYACGNIADTYAEMDSLLKAKNYILEFQEQTTDTKDPDLKVMAKNYLGILYYNEKQYYKAVSNYINALQPTEDLADQQLITNVYLNLGKAYQELNLFDKADSCFNKAIVMSTAIDVKEERKDAYEQIMKNAEIQNDYKKAFHYSRLLKNLSDSLVNEQSQQVLAEAESKYKFEEKNKLIDLLNEEGEVQKSETERQRLLKNITVISGLLMLIIIGLFFNRYKLRRRIERQQILLKERRRISRDLHDDVGATLSSVKAYSEILRDNPNNPLIADLINSNATEMIDRLEVIAWAANPKNDSFESLQNMINRYAAPLYHAKNMAYKFSSHGIEGEINVPGEIRQSLYLIAKEAVNNTIKYSGAANCFIHAEIEGGKFILQITDDGSGFDEKETSFGNGLNNMHSRLQEIGGSITITSLPGNGTTIKIQLPYPFKIPNLWDRKKAAGKYI